jgi:hypothetical protein
MSWTSLSYYLGMRDGIDHYTTSLHKECHLTIFKWLNAHDLGSCQAVCRLFDFTIRNEKAFWRKLVNGIPLPLSLSPKEFIFKNRVYTYIDLMLRIRKFAVAGYLGECQKLELWQSSGEKVYELEFIREYGSPKKVVLHTDSVYFFGNEKKKVFKIYLDKPEEQVLVSRISHLEEFGSSVFFDDFSDLSTLLLNVRLKQMMKKLDAKNEEITLLSTHKYHYGTFGAFETEGKEMPLKPKNNWLSKLFT